MTGEARTPEDVIEVIDEFDGQDRSVYTVEQLQQLSSMAHNLELDLMLHLRARGVDCL